METNQTSSSKSEKIKLDFKDTQCGSKIFRRKTVENIDEGVNDSGYAFDACLL